MEGVGDFEYNAKDLIGHGAFAVVFKGRHKKNPSATVAIKSITKKNLSKSHNLLGKEIKILKELAEVHHENIVALLDCKETQHHVFLVMEYCNGGDLADYLSVKGTLSEDTIRNFLKQLAGAMRALQIKGIVHRDLKPQNILLSHAGKPNPQPSDIRLKIADFGFARFLQDGVMAATLCGSPMYMAPEVIMSLQYDAKADLWSLGTIVFQCLTGRAPFTAQTPQALKMFYERNQNLSPKIPAGTSAELTDLLQGLLRRNAKDRMEFDDFFNHVFIRKNVSTVPISSANTAAAAAAVPTRRSPPLPVPTPVTKTAPVPVQQQQQQQNNNAPTPEEADDFVLVPSPSQQRTLTAGFNGNEAGPEVVTSGVQPSQPIPVPSQRSAFLKLQASQRNSDLSPLSSPSSSPGAAAAAVPVPGSLPRSQPISVMERNRSEQNLPNRPSGTGLASDINSLSPPSVQFCVGTPPAGGITIGMGFGSRRRSTSGSSCCSGTSPPPFSASPWPQVTNNSPLRRTGSNNFNNPPSVAGTGGSGSLAPIMGSPTRVIHPGATAWAHPTRAMTLPELACGGRHSPSVTICSSTGVHRSQTETAFGLSTSPGNKSPGLSGSNWSLQRKSSFEQQLGGIGGAYGFGTSPPPMEGPIVFVAPELTQETLMEKEHNDTLAKLNFVLALVECIVEVARSRASPLAAALNESTHSHRPGSKTASSPSSSPSCGRDGQESPSVGPQLDGQRRVEQLVLYVRALQLLSSALNLSKEELQAERLHASSSVKQVLSMLNQRFHHCLSQCKQLHAQSVSRDTQTLATGDSITAQLTADKLLYNHAIDLCQSAALDELFGNPASCCRRYQTAHILFHSLAQQVTVPSDKNILNKYKEAVEKRLFVLQQQGFIYAFDTT